MLRKVQKDLSKGELMSDSCSNLSPKLMSTSFFSIPGLFVGFSSKGLSDYDVVRSPTSPLDARIFSAFGSSFWSQRSDLDGLQSQRKNWCSKGIGLGIVDSLNDVRTLQLPNSLGKAESKSILFGPQLRISVPQCKGNPNDCSEKTCSCVTSPKSLPNYVFSAKSLAKSGLSHLECPQFAVEQDVTPSGTVKTGKSYRSCSSESINTNAEFLLRYTENGLLAFDSGLASPQPNGGVRHFAASSNCNLSASFSAGEIELSEDYTCVITHGPNPKTKHIYGDFVLEEDHSLEIPVTNKPEESGGVARMGCNSFGMGDFLSTCHTCKKKLADGEDIYMYRSPSLILLNLFQDYTRSSIGLESFQHAFIGSDSYLRLLVVYAVASVLHAADSITSFVYFVICNGSSLKGDLYFLHADLLSIQDLSIQFLRTMLESA